jgi:RNA polymerase sigma factor (sigma-70 family)
LIRWHLIWQQRLSEGEAEEIATIVIEDVAMKKIDCYKGDGDGFAGWLLKIAVNTARSRHRKEGGIRTEPISTTLAAHAQATQEDLEGYGAKRTDDHHIHTLYEAIRLLRPEDQAFLQMAYGAESKTWEEIAEKLGITVGAAKTRGCRIRQRLRKIVTQTMGQGVKGGGE